MDLQSDHLIPGLIYHPNFITKAEEKMLMEVIAGKTWNTALKRRTQHYGYEYSYDRNSVVTKTEQIPDQFLEIKKRIEGELVNPITHKYTFDQLIVNEYEPGQGISPHIDNTILFDGIIVSVSLGSECVMQFTPKESEKDQNRVEVVLERRSVLLLEKEARYMWKHCIPGRKKDYGHNRSLRHSLTFRKMIL